MNIYLPFSKKTGLVTDSFLKVFRASVTINVRAIRFSISVRCHDGVIAQIGPLSFQAAIEHKPRQVRWGGLHAPVVTEW